VIPFDIHGGHQAAEWFRFLSAPGTASIRVQAKGTVEAWMGGEPMRRKAGGCFVADKVSAAAAVVALRIVPDAGYSGGAVLPEPVAVETDGSGKMELGNWSTIGILNNYSGGVRYRTTFAVTKQEAAAGLRLDLGSVAATAEVVLNGKKVAVLVAPPWKADITGQVREGDNTLEVLVFSTLANHFQTVPSTYVGRPVAGLQGPVRLLVRE
jgi:hypothetical protein